ncbi:hypothetical protein ACIHFC_31570 [Streptomyces sp. NPDC052013]|uniref:hypothetical protein n=1 Tax=unclassified Streptomyces TaxID=2593676 RepID=UPI00344C3593
MAVWDGVPVLMVLARLTGRRLDGDDECPWCRALRDCSQERAAPRPPTRWERVRLILVTLGALLVVIALVLAVVEGGESRRRPVEGPTIDPPGRGTAVSRSSRVERTPLPSWSCTRRRRRHAGRSAGARVREDTGVRGGRGKEARW